MHKNGYQVVLIPPLYGTVEVCVGGTLMGYERRGIHLY